MPRECRFSHRSRAASFGSKGGGNQYDPQVASAAQSEADTAKAAQAFDENYYTNTIAPLLSQEGKQAATTADQQTQLFNIEKPQAQASANEYTNYGLPAETNFYNLATQYSAPAQQEAEANAALGDQRTAQGAAAANTARQEASYGISPTSGQSISARSVANTSNAAASAQAETQARYNAKQMGMQLTADAANLGAGLPGASAVAAGGASSYSTAATGALAAASGSAANGANPVNQGYQIASNAYGNNLNAYTSLNNSSMQYAAQGAQGFGQALGALGALATKIPI